MVALEPTPWVDERVQHITENVLARALGVVRTCRPAQLPRDTGATFR